MNTNANKTTKGSDRKPIKDPVEKKSFVEKYAGFLSGKLNFNINDEKDNYLSNKYKK